MILVPVLVAGSWLVAGQLVSDLEARLVRDANELFTRTYPRPVHVDVATPGALGDAIPQHLPPFEAEAKALVAEDLQRTRDVVSGAAPVVSLPASFAAALARLEPHLDALLAATHAERADFPATKDPLMPLDDGGWIGWQAVGTFAGMRMRVALAASQPRDALRDGLDGIALARDASIARGLIGRMVGAAIISRLTPPTSAAIDALPDSGGCKTAIRRLRSIREAIPPFSRTLADETVLTQLYLGKLLPDAVRAALHPRVHGVLRDGLRDVPSWQQWVWKGGWRDQRAAQDALVAAADLPDQERAAAFASAATRLRRSFHPLAAVELPDYGRYARRADAAMRRLDALILAAAAGAYRSEHGRWPASLAELQVAGDLDGTEATRLAGAALLPAADGHTLSMRVPLPQVEKEPTDLVLILRGPQAGRD